MIYHSFQPLRSVCISLAGSLGLFSVAANAQTDLPTTELIVLPKFTYNAYALRPQYNTQQGGLQLAHNPDKPPKQVFNSQGLVSDVSINPFRYGLDLGVMHTGRDGYGFSFVMGADWGRQIYSSVFNTRFLFNGNSVNSWNVYLNYWQLNTALTYYWLVSLGYTSSRVFIRLSGHRSFSHRLAVPQQPVLTAYPLDYTENGQGDHIELQKYTPHILFVEPEVGFQLTKTVEVSASFSIPLQGAYREQHSLLENNQLRAVNTIDYRLGGAYLTARLLLPIKRYARKVPLPPVQPIERPTPTVTYQRGQVIQLKNVYFNPSSAELQPGSYKELDKLVGEMSQHPTLRIRLEGHTDVIGDAQQNQQLSEERVAAIQQYMASQGIDHHRISLKGYGDKRPLKRDCPPPAGCPENRRVEFIVITN